MYRSCQWLWGSGGKAPRRWAIFVRFWKKSYFHPFGSVEVVFFYCRAKTNAQIANSTNIGWHELARREEAKDQNKNVA